MTDGETTNNSPPITSNRPSTDPNWLLESYERGLVSVIIPVYNRERLIVEALESVRAQTYRPVETIVVDDCSTDNTVAMCRQVAETWRAESGLKLRILEQSHKGQSAAANFGLRESKGNFVRFLDSDDWLFPEATAAQVEVLIKTGADVCYGEWIEKSEGHKITQDRQGVFKANLDPDPIAALLGDQWCPNFDYLILRETAIRVGGWGEHYEALKDRDFINRIAFMGANFIGISETIGCYRQHCERRASRDYRDRWLKFMKKTIDDGIEWLDKNSAWTDARRQAVALSVFHHARRYHSFDRSQFRECIQTLREVSPHFKPPGKVYPSVVWILGYERAESLRQFCRRLLRRI